MKTTKATSEEKINQLLDESFHGSRVMQGGGSEVLGNNLQEMILEAADNSLARLYPKFSIGDKLGWDKVYKKAKEGAPDALKAVGYDGDADKHAVCKAIIGQIAAGKKGSDLRSHFDDAPYGWDRDVIDGGLQVLLMAGIILAKDDKGILVNPRDLERKAIGKVTFKIESDTVTTPQRIQVRKLFQQVKLPAKSGEELASVPQFIEKLTQLADSAGGEAPKPEPPNKSSLDDIRLASGNEQLLVIYSRREELKQLIDDWDLTCKKIDERWPGWQQLQGLLAHAGHIKAADEARQQTEAIENQRLLLATPDPITPLVKSVEDTLRMELTSKHGAYSQGLSDRAAELAADDSWSQLSEDQQSVISKQCDIEPIESLQIATQDELITAMQSYPISSWDDRIDALTGRFSRAREKAAKELQPDTQSVEVPRRTLKTTDDVKAWLDETGKVLNEAVAKGPVVIK
jgi:hypothetical protein